MTEVSMKYNGSGYYDETPYKAIMQMAKPGEIWTSTMGKEFLVLKNHGKFSTVLRLLDRLPFGATDCIEVDCLEQQHWVNPSMLVHMFNDTFGESVAKISESEYLDIMETVGERLGVTITVQKAECCVTPELEEAKRRADSLYQAMERMQVKHACEMERLEKALAESKEECGTAVLACGAYEKRIKELESQPQGDPAMAVYKQLYHELLDKIIAGGGLK